MRFAKPVVTSALLLLGHTAVAQEELPILAHPLALAERLPVGVRRGLLFAASKDDRVVYLFGTIHAGKADAIPMDHEVLKVAGTVDRLALELDPRRTGEILEAFGAASMFPPGKTLFDGLTTDQKLRLERHLADAGLPALPGMRPWMVGVMLGMAQLTKAGYSANLSSEALIAGLATATGKPILELEGAKRQIEVLADGSDADQTQGLLLAMEDMESGKASAELERLLKAWFGAEIAGLDEAYATMRDDRRPPAEKGFRSLILERNEALAQRIAAVAQEPGACLVAVGALHLVGESSVLQHLRQKGFTIKRI